MNILDVRRIAEHCGDTVNIYLLRLRISPYQPIATVEFLFVVNYDPLSMTMFFGFTTHIF